MPRLVIISDTHGMHRQVEVPNGDILVHAGDLCGHGRVAEVVDFASWLAELPHAHKVIIAGNHDWCFERTPDEAEHALSGCHYLFDSGVELMGLNFWGSPWQPWFLDWAFNLQRGKPLRQKWELIPDSTDVLVTHGPPHGILDLTHPRREHVGCAQLLAAILRVKPAVHAFGHIHEGYGQHREHGVFFANASSCTLRYAPTNPPVVLDVDHSGVRPLT